MIEQIFDLPDNILGFKGSGEVTADDYQTVLIPALEATLKKVKRTRLLFTLDESFEGFTSGAAWEDSKVGLKHLSRFERIALVTDTDWMRKAISAFGFAMPSEIKVYKCGQLSQAREWILEPLPHGDLSFDFIEEQGVLVLRPQGELNSKDFVRASNEIDLHIDGGGQLKGIMIVAEHFPGWEDFGAFFAHMRFIKDHRKQVKRLAIVTNDKLLSVLPHIVSHFIVSESQHFTMEHVDQALDWVSQE